jgi:hypothetical protein
MYAAEYEIIKQRELCFSPLHPDPDQAQSALLLLSGVSGIHAVTKKSRYSLEILYDLRLITLHIIDEALVELGFHLDNSLLAKLRRALFYYIEETQRANMGYHQDINSTQEVFVNRYQQLPHGCRDDRPTHWREYL